MARADWRSPGAYEDLRSLDAPGFAWEFLRRNPAFRATTRAWRAAAEANPQCRRLDGFARRWGVRFRRDLIARHGAVSGRRQALPSVIPDRQLPTISPIPNFALIPLPLDPFRVEDGPSS